MKSNRKENTGKRAGIEGSNSALKRAGLDKLDVCGKFKTNLSVWLSGTWFDLDLVGGAFKGVADALPFVHAVKAGRAALSGSSVFPDLWWVIGYAVVIMAIAILIFMRKMNSDNP